MMLTTNRVSRQNQTQKLNTHTINPHNELPLKLMNALGTLCKELVYLLISSTNHFNHSNVPVAITRMHGRNVGMDADTCKNTRCKQAQTLCTHADVDIPTLARSHLTMGISVGCVDTYGIDFPWQHGPSIATNIGGAAVTSC